MKKVITNLTLFVVSLILVVVIGEVVARFYLSYQDKLLRQKCGDNLLTQVPKKELFTRAQPGSFANRPNAALRWWGLDVHTDSLGCRRGAAAPDNARVLLFLGDSMIFGLGLADSLTIPALLQNELNRLHPETPCRVVNAGVIGYDFQQYYYQLQRLAPLVKPALVLVGVCYNDLLPNEDPFGDALASRQPQEKAEPPATVQASSTPAPRRSTVRSILALFEKLALYELWQRSGLAARVTLSHARSNDPLQWHSEERASPLVDELINLTGQFNAPVAFVYFPVYQSLGTEGEIIYLSLLKERQQPVLDLSLSPVLNKESYFLRENNRGRMDADIHFNLRGSQEVAANLGRWLVEQKLWN